MLVDEIAQPYQKANYDGYADKPVQYIQEKLRAKITPDQIRITNALMEHGKVMVKSCHSSGKCKSGNDWVYLSNGKRVQAKTLVGQTFKTLTLGELGVKEVMARAEWNKLEGTYQVITESGRQIFVNQDHPLWMAIENKTSKGFEMDIRGWTPIKNIEIGDLVAVTKEFPAFGPKTIPEQDLILLAHLITNSYKEFDKITIINKSPEQFNQLTEALSTKGSRLSALTQENRYVVEFSNAVDDMLWSYGISDSFRHRKLPSILFDLNKDSAFIFIKAILASNNLIVKNPNEAKFKFYHRSERLIRDISFMLLKFGICSKIYKKEDNNFWVLRIINIEEFVKIFGMVELDYLAEGSPDSRLDWRFEDAPPGSYWEKIKNIKWAGREWTVAISVPKYESYLTDFYEHNSYLAGALVNWNYDCFAESISLTTAPNEEVVKDVIWKEIRNHRAKIPQAIQDLAPKDMRMQNGPNHFATGYVAASEAGARGRKSPNLLIVFDEADGIRPEFFDSAEGMLIAENARHLVLLNPIHMDSRAAAEEENFYTITLSALKHPNVVAELKAGGHLPQEQRPFTGIDMNLAWVNDKIMKMTREIEKSNVKLNTSDFQWPPAWMYEDPRYETFLKEIGAENPRYYRPKPNTEFEPRVLGEWMSNTDIAIWTDGMWQAISEEQKLDIHSPVQIGIDPAGQGKDSTVFVVIRGKSALHIESHEGWDTLQIVAKAKELATTFGYEAGMSAETVPVKIDQTSNRAIYDLRAGFNFIPVNSSERALEPDKYPNRRSELWFHVADMANELQIGSNGSFIPMLDISRIIKQSPEDAKELKRQLKAAEFKIRAGGKREVEPKPAMQKKLKRSPDHADAFNLAYASFANEGGTRTFISSKAADSIRRHLGRRYRR